MLTNEPTAEKLENWQKIWKEYKNKITPNRKSGEEIVNYLRNKYPVCKTDQINGMDISEMLNQEITDNDFLSWKLPVGQKPDFVAFSIENIDAGENLYKNQDELFKGLEIFVAVDMVTGYFHVEGSSQLYDELRAFQGLDEIDLENFFIVAEYVECCNKFNIKIV